MTTAPPDLVEVLHVLDDLLEGAEALLDIVGDVMDEEFDRYFDAYDRARPLLKRARVAGLLAPRADA